METQNDQQQRPEETEEQKQLRQKAALRLDFEFGKLSTGYVLPEGLPNKKGTG